MARPSLFLGSMPLTASRMISSGFSAWTSRKRVSLCPPGYSECLKYIFSSRFRPVTRTFSALTTTTWSPTSRCVEYVGFLFPLSTLAISLARRPRICPSASTTYHSCTISEARTLYVPMNPTSLLYGWRKRQRIPVVEARCQPPPYEPLGAQALRASLAPLPGGHLRQEPQSVLQVREREADHVRIGALDGLDVERAAPLHGVRA